MLKVLEPKTKIGKRKLARINRAVAQVIAARKEREAKEQRK